MTDNNADVIVTHDLESLTHYRSDGTYEGVVNGLPYHVIPGDVLWERAVAMATAMGDDLPLQPPVMPGIVEYVLTARQLRLGLLRIGINSTAVLSLIDSINDIQEREEIQIEWEYATTYTKTNAFVQLLKTELFPSESAFDEFWSSSALL